MKDSSKSRRKYPWIFEVLERDGYVCVDCGYFDDSKKKWSKIIVHHVDASRNSDKPNHDLGNLVTLCKSCHSKRHYHNRL